MIDVAPYVKYLSQRKARESLFVSEKREEAWQIAQNISRVLKQKYGVETVYVFGSVLKADYFTKHSDIDIAIQNISPQSYWRALSEANALAGEFQIDLVDMNDCRDSIRQSILDKGVKL